MKLVALTRMCVNKSATVETVAQILPILCWLPVFYPEVDWLMKFDVSNTTYLRRNTWPNDRCHDVHHYE